MHPFNQTSACVLFRLPPVFVLHFVDGLPNNDVRMYTFTFEGKRHSVTTVIQYDQQRKHFVTWICNSDGRLFESTSFMVLQPDFQDMTCKQYLYHRLCLNVGQLIFLQRLPGLHSHICCSIFRWTNNVKS